MASPEVGLRFLLLHRFHDCAIFCVSVQWLRAGWFQGGYLPASNAMWSCSIQTRNRIQGRIGIHPHHIVASRCENMPERVGTKIEMYTDEPDQRFSGGNATLRNEVCLPKGSMSWFNRGGMDCPMRAKGSNNLHVGQFLPHVGMVRTLLDLVDWNAKKTAT